MPLIDPHETVRLDLPAAGEWVDVRARLSAGDQAQITRATLRGMRVRPGDAIGELDVGDLVDAQAFARLEHVVRGWSFGVPVTPDNLRLLDQESVDYLRTELDRLYGVRGEADISPLGGNGLQPHSTVGATLPRSDG